MFDMLGIITGVSLGVQLGVIAVVDIMYRKIWTWLLLCMGGIGIALRIVSQSFLDPYWLLGLIPGLVLLGVHYIGKNWIGSADGLVILSLAGYCSPSQVIGICSVSFLLAGIVGLMIKVGFAKQEIKELPFIPFILLGYLLILI